MNILKGVYSTTQITKFFSRRKSTLRDLYVVFRHGDRTPDGISMYPKDPYLEDNWHPYGLGALTNHGKMQMYNIGRTLRKAYGELLGDVYKMDVMDAYSTNYARTKMSLELVLAGLWPPTLIQRWHTDLLWQPIPYDIDTEILNFPLLTSNNYKEKYFQIIETDEIQYYLKTNSDHIKYINKHSGLDCVIPLDLFILYFGLSAEEATGRKLPEWTKKVYPDFLQIATKLEYKIQTYNDELKRMTGGYFIKKFIENTKDRIENRFKSNQKKLYLYSGHEYNIVYILSALNLYEPHIPKYASYVAIELHEINEQYGFKVLYQDYEQDYPRTLIIPGCEEYCPFYKFLDIAKNIIANDNN